MIVLAAIWVLSFYRLGGVPDVYQRQLGDPEQLIFRTISRSLPNTAESGPSLSE